MTILFTLVNLIVIALVARWAWKRLGATDALVFWPALMLRLTAGLFVGILYTFYYHGVGDTFAYFNDAVEITKGNFDIITAEPRSRFFVFVVGAINLITHNNYWVSSLWLSLFSFLCAYRLVLKLDRLFPSLRVASRIALLFVPSVVFWSSGIIKESLALGAVSIIAIYFLDLMRGEKFTLRSAIEILLSLLLLLILKYYWAAVLLPCMITAMIIRKIDPKRFVFVWFVFVLVLLSLAASFTHPNFHLDRFLNVIVENHEIYIVRTPGDKLISYYNFVPTWGSMVINSPVALVSGLFRPMVFETKSVLGFLAALENLAILVLVLWKIRSIRVPKPENRLIVFAVVMYTIILCIFLALSTPNLGTLSRYRVGFLPFFVLLILADHPILNFINGKSSHHIRS